MAKQSVRIYCTGGAGTNIGLALETARENSRHSEQFANLDIVYIDTSDSNHHASMKEEHTYHIQGMKGSGKVRGENAEVVLDPEFVADVFKRFEPGELNIFVHGAGGGSGATIAHGMVSELMNRGASVLIVVIGSTSTRTDSDNTLKTVKSYDGLVQEYNQPLTILYRENNREFKRHQVDQDVNEAILSLAVLWSGNNRELDQRDLQNWLRYDRVTAHPIELNQLVIQSGAFVSSELDMNEVASVATLAHPGQDTDLDPAPEVQFVGYFQKDEGTRSIDEQLPMNFLLVRNYFSRISGHLKDDVDKHRKQEHTRQKSAPLLTKDDKRTKGGFVL